MTTMLAAIPLRGCCIVNVSETDSVSVMIALTLLDIKIGLYADVFISA